MADASARKAARLTAPVALLYDGELVRVELGHGEVLAPMLLLAFQVIRIDLVEVAFFDVRRVKFAVIVQV